MDAEPERIRGRSGAQAREALRRLEVVDLFRQLRVQGAIAPKTVHNIYGVLKALFRDAHLADLVTTSPCILTRHQLGENVDKDPTRRATAVFTRDELEILISDSRVPRPTNRGHHSQSGW